jgi:cell division control protein 11
VAFKGLNYHQFVIIIPIIMDRVPSSAMVGDYQVPHSILTAKVRQKRPQKKGTKFTMMLCGPRGSGKTTFINTLCGRNITPLEEEPFDPSKAHEDPGIQFDHLTEELPDDVNGPLTLKFIDTPGFGDNVDNTSCFTEIANYIERQFDDVLAEESRIKRNPRFTDNRVHALIYFITPRGHGLCEMDVEFMKLIATKVNVIPVISKADSMTPDELALNKRLILEDIDHYNIPIYQFPDDSEIEGDDDDASSSYVQASSLRSSMPFAIVGGSTVLNVKGRSIVAREYLWGYIDVEDPEVSDFPLLRDLLLHSHMADLKETTFDFLYENYRTEKLSRDMPSRSSSPDSRARPGYNPEGESVASNSYLAREEQLRVEEEKLRAIEQRVQEEIAQKRLELLKREQELKDLEARLKQEAVASSTATNSPIPSVKSETTV